MRTGLDAAVSLQGLRIPVRQARPEVLTLVALWVAAGAADSLTTAWMMGRGFTEGNPIANWGMGWVGVAPYCTIAFLFCLCLAGLAASCRQTLYGATIFCTLALLGMVKCYVAVNNMWILAGFAALPGLG